MCVCVCVCVCLSQCVCVCLCACVCVKNVLCMLLYVKYLENQNHLYFHRMRLLEIQLHKQKFYLILGQDLPIQIYFNVCVFVCVCGAVAQLVRECFWRIKTCGNLQGCQFKSQ